MEVLDRIRLELAARLSTSDLPGFTASYGLVDADRCSSLAAAVRLADDALYAAKERGRDRAVIAPNDDAVDDRPPTHVIRIAEAPRQEPTGVLASLAHDDDPLEV